MVLLRNGSCTKFKVDRPPQSGGKSGTVTRVADTGTAYNHKISIRGGYDRLFSHG